MTALLTFNGSAETDPAIATWFATKPAELRSMAKAWFQRMRHCGSDVRELLHDGCANVCVQDAPFAYVAAFTSHVNVGFFHGVALADPAKLLQGSGKHMRHVKIRPGHGFDELALDALIAAAYQDIRARLAPDQPASPD